MNYLDHPKFDAYTNALEDDRGLPRGTLRAIVTAETGGVPRPSKAGAQGLTQFMPATAKQYNVDVNNPWDSLRGAADLLEDNKKKYGGNMAAAISAYNGGDYNARAVLDGKAPSTKFVSPANHAENKRYTKQVTGLIPDLAQPKEAAQAPSAAPTKLNKVDLARFVNEHAQRGSPANVIVESLKADKNHTAMVEAARSRGYTDDEIAQRLGGKQYTELRGINTKVNQMGVLDTLDEGTKIGLRDIGHASKQLWTRLAGSKEDLAKLQAEQKTREADPYRKAILNTKSGTVGNVVGTAVPGVVGGAVALAAAPVVGGGAVLGTLGAGVAGAAGGALQPTTGEGQIGRNMAVNSVLNMAPGIGKMGAKVVGNAIDNKIVGDMTRNELRQRAQKYAAAGMDIRDLKPSQVFENARAGTNVLDTHVAGSGVLQPKGPALSKTQKKVIDKELGVTEKGGLVTPSKALQVAAHYATGGTSALASGSAAVGGNLVRRKLNNPKNTKKLIDKVMTGRNDAPVAGLLGTGTVAAGVGTAGAMQSEPEPMRDTIARAVEQQTAQPSAPATTTPAAQAPTAAPTVVVAPPAESLRATLERMVKNEEISAEQAAKWLERAAAASQ